MLKFQYLAEYTMNQSLKHSLNDLIIYLKNKYKSSTFA